MQDRTLVAYLLLFLVVAGIAAVLAIHRARVLKDRSIRHGRRRDHARRKYRWWRRR